MNGETHCRLSVAVLGWIVLVGLAGRSTAQSPNLTMDLPPAPEADSFSDTLGEPAVAADDLSATGQQGEIEVITERYADRSVTTQREVVLDESMNYVNHGSYTTYDPVGKVLETGTYRMGKMDGQWAQIVDSPGEGLMPRDRRWRFPGPYVSAAEFREGRLDGSWTVSDRDGRRIFEGQFDQGAPHGVATWWYPNGQRRMEAAFEHGLPVGEMRQWGPDGKAIDTLAFYQGRPLVDNVEWHAKGRKASEGAVLATRSVRPDFSWQDSRATLDQTSIETSDVRHGVWTTWHPNGRKKAEGRYREGIKAGEFTWWYENGQIQAQGTYDGGRETGTWTTWHDNGMKESAGEYADGRPAGKWMKWAADGKLVEIHDFDVPQEEEQLGLDLGEEPDESTTGDTEQIGLGTGEGDTGDVLEYPLPADPPRVRTHQPFGEI